MQDFRIAFTRPADGGVSIVYPATGITLEACMEAVPVGADFKVLTDAEIPADRDFRNAWVMSGNRVDHDIEKAKAIAHDMRRKARDQEMAPLDVKATIPSFAVLAEAQREVLRGKYASMQTEIDTSKTVDSLRAAIDTIISTRSERGPS